MKEIEHNTAYHMSFFEGKEISIVSGEIPGRRWDSKLFTLDWLKAIAHNTLFSEHELKVAQAVIVKKFYETYETLLNLMEENDLTTEDKIKLTSYLNRVMLNVLEWGTRRSADIVLSMIDRKFPPERAHADLFNSMVDHLVQEVRQADKIFHEALKTDKK